MFKAIYFDLYFTLIVPAYGKADNEFDILNLSVDEWEQYAENDLLYRDRALGLVKTETEIIDKIVSLMPFEVSVFQKEQVLLAREKRMKAALKMVSDEILDALQKIKSSQRFHTRSGRTPVIIAPFKFEYPQVIILLHT